VLDRAIGRVITDAGMVEFPLAPDLSPASGSAHGHERRRRHVPDVPPAGAGMPDA
jgi:hypothetical protein